MIFFPDIYHEHIKTHTLKHDIHKNPQIVQNMFLQKPIFRDTNNGKNSLVNKVCFTDDVYWGTEILSFPNIDTIEDEMDPLPSCVHLLFGLQSVR